MLEERFTDSAAIRISGRLTPEILAKAEVPIDVRMPDTARSWVAQSRSVLGKQAVEVRGDQGAVIDRWAAAAAQGEHASHRIVGHHDDLPANVVRAAVLARLWTLADADSGASIGALSALTAMLGTGFAPAVPMPRAGLLGADYDRFSFTHIVRALRGEGHAFVGGKRMPAAEALHAVGLTAAKFDVRDEYLLVGGTSLTVAAAALSLASVRRSHSIAVSLTALLLDVLGYSRDFPAPEMLGLSGHPQVAAVILRMRDLLAGASPTEIGPSPMPYALCCSPDLLGAAGETIRAASAVVDDDLNDVGHNPMRLPGRPETVHDGPVRGQQVVPVTDLLNSSTAMLGSLAQLQLDLLIEHRADNSLSQPAATPEQQHRVVELKTLATSTTAALRRAVTGPPHRSSSNTHEPDASPFDVHAWLSALDHAASLRLLHGMLAVTLRQAVHISGRRPTAPACTAILYQLIERIPPRDPHRPLLDDIHTAAHLLDAEAPVSPAASAGI
ncbi:aromatic amino acid lyase [Nocardia araoensis]|uniref:aromatic amino acid lyase n=1 Tax=Nocardia araoensis TaxID=228600 RepID=UPI0002EC3353|nr:aromatic amino acid lyase [Nocardia araoensis]